MWLVGSLPEGASGPCGRDGNARAAAAFPAGSPEAYEQSAGRRGDGVGVKAPTLSSVAGVPLVGGEKGAGASGVTGRGDIDTGDHSDEASCGEGAVGEGAAPGGQGSCSGAPGFCGKGCEGCGDKLWSQG